jgi:hypothetical protein
VQNWRVIVNLRHIYAEQKHKLTKLVEPLALFMSYLDNERELMQHIIARASQHAKGQYPISGLCGEGRYLQEAPNLVCSAADKTGRFSCKRPR